MKVLLAGGGSGGHVTPLRAIAKQLRKEQSDIELRVLTDRGFYDQTVQVFGDIKSVTIKNIFAGKLRRYQGRSLVWHFTHLPTLLRNIRDIVYLGLGFLQSLAYMLISRPDVVFCKGGFVCVPIGYVARLLKIDLVIHDSDAKPGLTNRLLARYASSIATGMPAEFYPYEKKKVVYTGMPVSNEYKPLTTKQQNAYKKQLGIDLTKKVLLVTGGGNGAENLNLQLTRIVEQLIDEGWAIIQLAGKGKAGQSRAVRDQLPESKKESWQIEEFADMAPRLLAADVIVTRTSANTLQECANAEKAVIGVASRFLADQALNSQFFASKGAITALSEAELAVDGQDLYRAIMGLKNSDTASEQAGALYKNFAKPSAAEEIADIILNFK